MNSREMADYMSILIKLIIAMGAISFLCCLSVIILFITKKHLRTFVCELLFHMAVSEIFNSITKMLSFYKLLYEDIEVALNDENNWVCYLQRVFGYYSDFSTFIVIVIISYTLNDIMMKMSKDVVEKIVCFRYLIYLVPAAISCLAILPSDSPSMEKKVYQCWCWVPRQYSYVSGIFYFAYWIFIISNILMIWKTTSFLKKLMKRSSSTDLTTPLAPNKQLIAQSSQNSNDAKIKKMINKLYVYPIMAVLIWVVASSSRVYEFFYYQIDDIKRTDTQKLIRLILYTLHAVVMSLRGFIYTLVYFMRYEKINREVKATWKDFCNFICCKPGRKDTFMSSDESVNAGK